jgi:hypothetical protein
MEAKLKAKHTEWMASMLETNASARRVGDSMEFTDVGDTQVLLAEYKRRRDHEWSLFREYMALERASWVDPA